jgi:hypothetical protein
MITEIKRLAKLQGTTAYYWSPVSVTVCTLKGNLLYEGTPEQTLSLLTKVQAASGNV